MKYYNDKIHGMERGQKEGCYVDIGKTAVLPDDLGIISFNKIWYTKDSVHVFYDLTPGDSIQLKEGVQVVGSNMIWNDNKDMSSGSNSIEGLRFDEWVSNNGRYYSVICFSNVKERMDPSDTALMVKLNLNLQISYNDNKTQQVTIKVLEVSFSIMYYPSMDKSYTVDINKTININNQTEIIFSQLIMEPQSSFLLIKLNSEIGNELDFLNGLLSTDKDETVKSWLSLEKIDGGNNDYKIRLNAINRIPSYVKITLQEVKLVTNNSLKFELSAMKFHGKFSEVGQSQEEQINKKIGSIGDKIEFTLEKIYWNDKGAELIISDNVNTFKSSVRNSSLNSWAEEENYKQHLTAEGKTLNRKTPNLVKITNEKGEEALMGDYYIPGGGTITIFKNFLDKSDTIHVEITNLIETITGSWETN